MAPIPGENHFTFGHTTASVDRLRLSPDEQNMKEAMLEDTKTELLSIFKLSPDLRRYLFDAGFVSPDGLVDPNAEEILEGDEGDSMEYESETLKEDASLLRSFFRANPRITESTEVKLGWPSIDGDEGKDGSDEKDENEGDVTNKLTDDDSSGVDDNDSNSIE